MERVKSLFFLIAFAHTIGGHQELLSEVLVYVKISSTF